MTPVEFEDYLNTQNKLYMAEFGIDKIIDLCHSLIEMNEAAGKTGSSYSKILGYSLEVKQSLAKVEPTP